MNSKNHDYYADRERRERELAGQCVDVAARRAHMELADRYRELSVPAPRAA